MKNCTGERCLIQYDKVDPATCKAVGYCPQATPPRTNADRIRAMTDEELADYLSKNRGGCRALTTKSYVCNYYDDNLNPDCKKCWLDWLRQEVGE